MKAVKPCYYAVHKGHYPGVYTSKEESDEAIRGYTGSRVRVFDTRSKAEQFVEQGHKMGTVPYTPKKIQPVQQPSVEKKRLASDVLEDREPKHTKQEVIEITDSPVREPPAPEETKIPTTVPYFPSVLYEDGIRTCPHRTINANSNEDTILEWNDAQKRVIEAALSGDNALFIGNAGAGKSAVMRHCIKLLNEKYQFKENSVGVCAFTGIAATNIGGCTMHHLLAMGTSDMAWKVVKKPNKIRDYRVIVIDEISMVSAEMFDLANAVCTFIRNEQSIRSNFGDFMREISSYDTNNKKFIAAFQKIIGNAYPAFGGIQLILLGDFLQLPPVEADFCFEALCWQHAIPKDNIIQTDKIFRQKNMEYVEVLNEIRIGVLSQRGIKMLNKMKQTKIPRVNGVEPTLICSTNDFVNVENFKSFSNLKGRPRKFLTCDQYVACDEYTRTMFEKDMSTRCPINIDLKIGTQLLLTKNIAVSAGLANGTRCVVVGWTREEKESYFDRRWYKEIPLKFTENVLLPVVRFLNGMEMPLRYQMFEINGRDGCAMLRIGMPCRYAWAISIHRSQGMTLDSAKIKLTKLFCPALAYVALSRVKDENCIELSDYESWTVARAHPKALEFHGIKKK